MSTHKFEKAGLGLAPFRCVGVVEHFITYPGGRTQAAGTCDYCGTGIRFEYLIKSSDGNKFVVGSDCVEKVGEVGQFRETRLKFARERRADSAAVRRAQREALWNAEIAARQVSFREANPEFCVVLDSYNGNNEFALSMKRTLNSYGNLTQPQMTAFVKTVESEAAKNAAKITSKFIGMEGDKFKNVSAKFTFCKVMGRGTFYPYPPQVLIKLETADGNVLVWWTSSWVDFTEGEYINVDFTIKGHSEYDGLKQTIVNRVKESKVKKTK
jgi:hypothetical protein